MNISNTLAFTIVVSIFSSSGLCAQNVHYATQKKSPSGEIILDNERVVPVAEFIEIKYAYTDYYLDLWGDDFKVVYKDVDREIEVRDIESIDFTKKNIDRSHPRVREGTEMTIVLKNGKTFEGVKLPIWRGGLYKIKFIEIDPFTEEEAEVTILMSKVKKIVFKS